MPFLKKNSGHNRATVSLITRNILVCDVEFCYKNISKIHNVKFIFPNFQKKKNIEKIHVDSEKSINSFKIKKWIGNTIIYRETNFFLASLNNFRDYYAKYFFDMVEFFRFLLYREVLKFWSHQTFSCECKRKASLRTRTLPAKSYILSDF